MQKALIAALMASALVFAGCASDSEPSIDNGNTAKANGNTTSNSNSGSANNSGSNSSNSSNTSSNNASTTPKTNAEIAGIVLKENGSDGNFAAYDISSGNINTLMVDGKTYSLPTDVNAEGFNDVNDSAQKIIVSNNLKYVRHGIRYIKFQNTDRDTILLFAQGQMTPVASMPATGVAQYSGAATYLNEQIFKSGDTGTIAASKFTVDFGKKTVAGTISSSPQHTPIPSTISLSARIDGNKFSGNNVNGAFFGSEANELAGAYTTDGNGGGTFGAQKQ